MPNSTEVLDVLEHRIIALEKLLIPNEANKISDKETILNKLMQTHLMVSTALVQRETIINVLNRLPELNELLDTSHFKECDPEIMFQIMLTLYPSLKAMLGNAVEFIELRRQEDTKHLDQICELQNNLQKLFANNSALYSECNNITQDIIKCLQENFNIINSLSEVFAVMDRLVSSIEDVRKLVDAPEE